jgi:hypothetical protein
LRTLVEFALLQILLQKDDPVLAIRTFEQYLMNSFLFRLPQMFSKEADVRNAVQQ